MKEPTEKQISDLHREINDLLIQHGSPIVRQYGELRKVMLGDWVPASDKDAETHGKLNAEAAIDFVSKLELFNIMAIGLMAEAFSYEHDAIIATLEAGWVARQLDRLSN